MYWRLKYKEYEQLKGAGNKALLQDLVDSGSIPGLIAYQMGQPVGWCSLGPREQFVRLSTSKILAPVDDQPVWSIMCFYIHPQMRGSGVATKLLEAAIDFARTHGAKILEGYPVEPKKGKTPSVFAFTGIASTFRKLAFREILRRSETRPIMRLYLKEPDYTDKQTT